MSAAPLRPPGGFLGLGWSEVRYGATAAGASILALFLAILFQLDQPYWAATTVLIVAQPVPGQVVGKGFYRALGTVCGAVAGAALVALFDQSPELFVAALAGWIALCTGFATLLRGFRSYGAVLSGYTAAIVALSAIAAPDQTFDIAVARASAILLGIVCGAAAAAVLLPARSRAIVLRRTAAAIGDAARLVADTAHGTASGAERRKVVAELGAIEALGPAAAAEDLLFRRRLAGLEGVLGELLALASALRACDDHVARLSEAERSDLAAAVRPWSDRVAAAARRVGDALAAGLDAGRLAEARDALREAGPRPEPDTAAGPADRAAIGRLVVGDRLHDALRHLGAAVEAHAYLLGLARRRPAFRMAFHRDPAQAIRNALRAFLAVGLSGAFVIASAWPVGGTFLTNVGVACSLFATQPRPSAAAFGFLRGAAMALACAFAVKFFVLPTLEGFASLAAVLFPVLLVATMATTVPGWLGTATAFNVLFLSNLAIANVTTYDPAAYLDGSLATLAAFAVGGTVFRVVLPTDPASALRRLAARLRADVAGLAGGRIRDAARHHARMYDRVGRLAGGTEDPALLGGGVSTLGTATEIWRLRTLPLASPARAVLAPALRALAEGRGSRVVRSACDEAAARLAGGEWAGDAAPVMRAVAALTAIRDAVTENASFYDGGAAA